MGDSKIFLELASYDESHWEGYFFYGDSLKHIILEGYDADGHIFLSSTDDQSAFVQFDLENKANDLVGTFKTDEQNLQVTLTESKMDLDKYKMDHLNYVKDSTATINGREIIWQKESHSHQTLFRIGQGFTTAQREFLNQKLDSIHANYAEIALQCNYLEVNLNLDLITDEFVSFTAYTAIYCGGAHPNYQVSGHNFDMKKLVSYEKINELYPNLDYFEVLKNKYHNDPSLDPECGYFEDKTYWEYAAWTLSKEGMTLTPSFPHAMTPCEEPFTLTHTELGKRK